MTFYARFDCCHVRSRALTPGSCPGFGFAQLLSSFDKTCIRFSLPGIDICETRIRLFRDAINRARDRLPSQSYLINRLRWKILELAQEQHEFIKVHLELISSSNSQSLASITVRSISINENIINGKLQFCAIFFASLAPGLKRELHGLYYVEYDGHGQFPIDE